MIKEFSESEKFFFDSPTCWKELSVKNKNSNFLYICCHSNNKTLALNSTDEIDMDNLRYNLASKLSENDICLIFLNGCSTAVEDEDGAFLEAIDLPGVYGFIGTETRVPDSFAFQFGVDFLFHFFYSGKPIYELMDILRRKHWPLSLVYGVYCISTVKVHHSSHRHDHIKINRNLSFERLGSYELN